MDSSLFHDVQMSNLFEDSKSFADAICLGDLKEIEIKYEREKSDSNFDLLKFVKHNFIVPNIANDNFKTNANYSASRHIDSLWDVLTRQPDADKKDSLIPLPHPYVVPGGRFREIYYWDSYFTMLGLVVSGRIDMVGNMLKNFDHLISTYGFIPNGNRSYFISRSQPPFFALMVDLYEKQGQSSRLFHNALEKEYHFWMEGHRSVDINGIQLNRYWDNEPEARPESYKEDLELAETVSDKKDLFLNLRAACESGWDFSSRWLLDHNLASIQTINILPIDLNCLICFLEQKIGLEKAANDRAMAINELMWNNVEGYYFDYHLVSQTQTSIKSLAGVFPLFMKIASSEQAERVAMYLEKHFLRPGGLLTTTNDTGQQWDAPNGWAPLQWMAIRGLLNYGHNTLAKDIANRWIKLNESVFERTGKFVEKYNVCDLDLKAGGGEYPVQDGFGWSNGVYLALKDLFS